jgi:phage gpG-like protein
LVALGRAELAPAQQQALGRVAEQLGGSVQELLSRVAGSDHSAPWLQTGALRNSIRTEADHEEAVVASNSLDAVYQEHGTSAVPPRPFFAPTGAAGAEDAAREVGRELAQVIRSLLQ